MPGSLTMMAVGTVIGGSFFLGSSDAVRAAGPAVILLYLVGGAMGILSRPRYPKCVMRRVKHRINSAGRSARCAECTEKQENERT